MTVEVVRPRQHMIRAEAETLSREAAKIAKLRMRGGGSVHKWHGEKESTLRSGGFRSVRSGLSVVLLSPRAEVTITAFTVQREHRGQRQRLWLGISRHRRR